ACRPNPAPSGHRRAEGQPHRHFRAARLLGLRRALHHRGRQGAARLAQGRRAMRGKDIGAPMKAARLNLLLRALAALFFVLSLLIGPAELGIVKSVGGLFAGGDEAAMIIMREIRLPRAILALGVGFSLGISGAVLQGFLRNPLAEPGIIGVSAMASLGAVSTFYTGIAGASLFALPAGALCGALIAVLVLLAIASRHGSTLTLILAGIALTSLANALTSLILNLSPNPFASYEIIFW